jgi:lycopene beta-cyclase
MGSQNVSVGHNHGLDIAIIGGGLAGGLIALALHRARPELRLQILERGDRLGGNHIWSFFASDVAPDGMALLEPLISHRWPGYTVRFPAHERQLETGYHSIRSEQFDSVLRAALPTEAIRTGSDVSAITTGSVTLANGEEIAANAVIDCRGAGDLEHLNLGWQKFVGLELQLSLC